MPETNLSTLFKLFSIAFSPPTSAQVETISAGLFQNDIKSIWEATELPQDKIDTFSNALRPYVGVDGEELLHELRREFTRLFLGDQPLIANSEGMWRMKAEGRRAVLIINTYSLEVADFMRQCGVVKAEGYNDCVDYIETECDFAAFLASEPDHLIDLEKDPASLLDEFLDKHLLVWAPGFCTEVATTSCVVYYQALSVLLSAFLDEL